MEVKGLLSPSFEISFLFVCLGGRGEGGSYSAHLSKFRFSACVCLSVLGGLHGLSFEKSFFFCLFLFCFSFIYGVGATQSIFRVCVGWGRGIIVM